MNIYKVPLYIRRNGFWAFLRFVFVEATDKPGAIVAATEEARKIQSDHVLAIDEDEIDTLTLTKIT